jgi:hypothetical protein
VGGDEEGSREIEFLHRGSEDTSAVLAGVCDLYCDLCGYGGAYDSLGSAGVAGESLSPRACISRTCLCLLDYDVGVGRDTSFSVSYFQIASSDRWVVYDDLAISSIVAICHILFPIVLNPWLMIFSY